MKNQVKAAMIITWMVVMSNIIQAQPTATVNFQTFYQELNPYGTWMRYADYGNVWMPNAGPDFRPYATNGYWALTDYGNTWVSSYAWGWAPFHYGRWLFDNFYGWLWVPGGEWAPAWVAWRSGDGYYGWAPLAPRVNINVAINIPNHHWYFVPQKNLCDPGLTRHFVNRTQVVTIYHHTTIVNHVHEEHNHRYFTGPSRHEIEARRGRSVEVYAVNRSDRPGSTVIHNRTINLYRPSFDSRRDDRRDNDHHSRNNQNRYDRRDDGRNNATRHDAMYQHKAIEPGRNERPQSTNVERTNTNNQNRIDDRPRAVEQKPNFDRSSNRTNERQDVSKPTQQTQRLESRQQSREFTQPDIQRHAQHNAREGVRSTSKRPGRSRR